MTNNEINEYLAENLFGIRLRCNGKSCGISASRVECGGCEYSVKQIPPDYCINAMPVLDELIKVLKDKEQYIAICKSSVGIYKHSEDLKHDRYAFQCITKDYPIHKAICRAAVEYLKGGASCQ